LHRLFAFGNGMTLPNPLSTILAPKNGQFGV